MSRLYDFFNRKDSKTENGAVTNSISLNPVLDLFFLSGASRSLSVADIEVKILAAMAHDPELAIKCVFWAGDIRGGAGERRFLKVALNVIRDFYPDTFKKNIQNIPEFSRFDTLFYL